MAAIARKFALRLVVFALAAIVLRADEAADLRARLADFSNALAAGHPAEAISIFSKSDPDYDKLRRYFTGLTNAFTVTNEVDFLSEPDESGAPPVLQVHWTLTLTDPATQASNRRAADIEIHFVREKNKWKIAGFSPIDIFDPAPSHRP